MNGTLLEKIENIQVERKLMYQKKWYLEQLFEDSYRKLLNGSHDIELQKQALLSLQMRYLANLNGENKDVLNPTEYKMFTNLVKKILEKIDVETIENKEYKYSVEEEVLRKYFLTLKNVDINRDKREYLNPLDNIYFCVKTMNRINDTIVLDAEIKNVIYLEHEDIRVDLISNEHKFRMNPTHIYADVEYFGRMFYRGYLCQVEIPCLRLNSKDEIKVLFQYNNGKHILPMQFESIYSKLYEKFTASYWKCGDKIIMYDKKNRALTIQKSTKIKCFIRELEFDFMTLFQSHEFVRSIKSIALRVSYQCLKPFFSEKEIWITYDQLYKAGDNGQYFYEYVAGLKEKIPLQIYYVIRKDTPEYKELSDRWNTIVAFNSFKHKLLSLYASVIFTTRTDVALCCGYWSGLEKYVRGLFECKVVCLQHGVTIQDMAKHQNRLKDNIQIYCCVSEYEKRNLLKTEYGYREDQLVLTGAPRYDGLISNPKKTIIISPTWRRNFIIEENKKGYLHEYNPMFKKTLYYQIYNRLINNTDLNKLAKENGYQVLFLLHPILSPQVNDFNSGDCIKVLSGIEIESYEKVLTEGSMLITDYSGIQFDFAYMKKPILYFQPKELPPQYGEGAMDYEKQAFGPLCQNEEDLLRFIEIYIKNECKMEQKYKDRVEKFFYYSDMQNSRRIYEISKNRFFVDTILTK